jgi:uncharacterized membrane protein YeiH
MSLPFFLEHLGVAVGALSAVLAARGLKIDLFGVLVLAVVSSFGGGSTRDLLIGDAPPQWMRSPEQLYSCLIVALAAFVVSRKLRPPRWGLEIADALALAFFTIVGTQKGLVFEFSMPVAVMLGVITGVAGGILRDVLLNRLPVVFQTQTYLYATAAFVGAALFCGVHERLPSSVALWGCVSVVFALRLAAIRFRIALPELRDGELP